MATQAVKHQQFVGTGYFDAVQEIVTGGTASTKALEGSTEAAQFADADEEVSSPNRQGPRQRRACLAPYKREAQNFPDPPDSACYARHQILPL